jgi:hypothetical protein
MRVYEAREFHVASVPRRSQRCGRRECDYRYRDRNHDKARPKPVLAAMAKVLERRPDRKSRRRFRKRYIYMRRAFYLLLASALLLTGLAFSAIEIVQAQSLKPFVLFNALIMVAAGGVWLLDDFVLRYRATSSQAEGQIWQ